MCQAFLTWLEALASVPRVRRAPIFKSFAASRCSSEKKRYAARAIIEPAASSDDEADHALLGGMPGVLRAVSRAVPHHRFDPAVEPGAGPGADPADAAGQTAAAHSRSRPRHGRGHGRHRSQPEV